MEEHIREKVKEYYANGWRFEFLLNDLYTDELNFNNADPTSGMRVYEADEIDDIIQDELIKLTKVK